MYVVIFCSFDYVNKRPANQKHYEKALTFQPKRTHSLPTKTARKAVMNDFSLPYEIVFTDLHFIHTQTHHIRTHRFEFRSNNYLVRMCVARAKITKT